MINVYRPRRTIVHADGRSTVAERVRVTLRDAYPEPLTLRSIAIRVGLTAAFTPGVYHLTRKVHLDKLRNTVKMCTAQGVVVQLKEYTTKTHSALYIYSGGDLLPHRENGRGK